MSFNPSTFLWKGYVLFCDTFYCKTLKYHVWTYTFHHFIFHTNKATETYTDTHVTNKTFFIIEMLLTQCNSVQHCTLIDINLKAIFGLFAIVKHWTIEHWCVQYQEPIYHGTTSSTNTNMVLLWLWTFLLQKYMRCCIVLSFEFLIHICVNQKLFSWQMKDNFWIIPFICSFILEILQEENHARSAVQPGAGSLRWPTASDMW